MTLLDFFSVFDHPESEYPLLKVDHLKDGEDVNQLPEKIILKPSTLNRFPGLSNRLLMHLRAAVDIEADAIDVTRFITEKKYDTSRLLLRGR